MLKDGGCEDNDAEEDDGGSGPDGEAGGVGRGMSGGRLELAEEEAEAGHGEAYAHETKASADPGEKGTLGGEVDARILFGRGIGGGGHEESLRDGSLVGGGGWVVGGRIAAAVLNPYMIAGGYALAIMGTHGLTCCKVRG